MVPSNALPSCRTVIEVQSCSATKLGASLPHQCRHCSSVASKLRSEASTVVMRQAPSDSSTSRFLGGSRICRRTLGKSDDFTIRTPAPRARLHSFSTATSSVSTASLSSPPTLSAELPLRARARAMRLGRSGDHLRGKQTCFGTKCSKPASTMRSCVNLLSVDTTLYFCEPAPDFSLNLSRNARSMYAPSCENLDFVPSPVSNIFSLSPMGRQASYFKSMMPQNRTVVLPAGVLAVPSGAEEDEEAALLPAGWEGAAAAEPAAKVVA
mmetsp:Transcript_77352/g.250343  ORF Transcript_77352/g.250343 Transcript_77352/m.250343 type:complete len:267 (-) Transcript_77352:663-1463(-)